MVNTVSFPFHKCMLCQWRNGDDIKYWLIPLCFTVCARRCVDVLWPGSHLFVALINTHTHTHSRNTRHYQTIVTSKAVNYHKEHKTNFAFALLCTACSPCECEVRCVLSYLFLCDAHKYSRLFGFLFYSLSLSHSIHRSHSIGSWFSFRFSWKFSSVATSVGCLFNFYSYHFNGA